MKKIVRIGTVRIGRSNASLFCRVEWNGVRLSITGVEGPITGGNARGSCGQIIMVAWDIVNYAPGWDAAKVQQFREVWKRWHLNDMKAGSPAQTAFLREHPATGYAGACAMLTETGLNPDPAHIVNGKPYVYGSAWLTEAVPADVIEFLQSLPDADKRPAWV